MTGQGRQGSEQVRRIGLARFLRLMLARFPWLVRGINRVLPASLLAQLRRLAERVKYADVSAVHDLPAIHQYWSRRYVLPILQELGFAGVEDFMLQHILLQRRPGQPLRLLGIGCGNCELDLALASQLQQSGCRDFSYTCLELNGAMLQRAAAEAERAGVAAHMQFQQCDIAQWQPQTRYDVIVTNQFLHHVPALEQLFRAIRKALQPDGVFLVSDMIGRNGHMRWPEALLHIDRLWSELDARYKYHHLHAVTNQRFVNWDASLTGFEGIRAQDILPLLVEHFGFDTFIAFGNLVDVFVDRPYGPNFDTGNAADLAFIDRVQALDTQLLETGVIKPTHMMAALSLDRGKLPRVYRHFTPQRCVRWPD